MAGKLGIGDLAAMGLGNVGVGPFKVGNVLDTVEFVKKAWASFGVPPGFAPTIDVEELDKRIADLKAVEQWLTVNMNMLQGTIQALEIQRGTIATLKAIGAPMAAAAGLRVSPEPGANEASGRGAPTPFTDPGLSPGAWWNLLQNQFNQVAAAALSGVGLPKPRSGGSAGRTKASERGGAKRAAGAGAQAAQHATPATASKNVRRARKA